MCVCWMCRRQWARESDELIRGGVKEKGLFMGEIEGCKASSSLLMYEEEQGQDPNAPCAVSAGGRGRDGLEGEGSG